MTLFLWFALVSAIVGYVAVTPLGSPDAAAGRGNEAGAPGAGEAAGQGTGDEAGDGAGGPAPRLSPGRGAWLGFLAGLAADLLWGLFMGGWSLATGTRPQGPGGIAVLGATGLVAFGAVWWVMFRRVFRVGGPALRRLVAILLLSYPVVLGLGIFLSR